jgi:hypothetical protein
MIPEPEDTFSMPSSHVVLDQVDIAFDDERAVASAGLLLPATSVPASQPATSATPTASPPASSSSNSRRLRPCANSAKAMSASDQAISRS